MSVIEGKADMAWRLRHVRYWLWLNATQALNLSAGVSICKVFRGRSFIRIYPEWEKVKKIPHPLYRIQRLKV